MPTTPTTKLTSAQVTAEIDSITAGIRILTRRAKAGTLGPAAPELRHLSGRCTTLAGRSSRRTSARLRDLAAELTNMAASEGQSG
jgi:hypothetical protein